MFTLKLIKIFSLKLMDQLNWNFVCYLFSKSNIYSIKIIKFWQLMTISKFNRTQSQCPLTRNLSQPCNIYMQYHHCVLPKERSFTANSGAKAAVLLKGRSSTANSGTKVAVLLGIYRCSRFPLLSTPHSLFSI